MAELTREEAIKNIKAMIDEMCTRDYPLGYVKAADSLRKCVEDMESAYAEEVAELNENLCRADERIKESEAIIKDMKKCIDGIPDAFCVDNEVCNLTEDNLEEYKKALEDYMEAWGESPDESIGLTHQDRFGGSR